MWPPFLLRPPVHWLRILHLFLTCVPLISSSMMTLFVAVHCAMVVGIQCVLVEAEVRQRHWGSVAKIFAGPVFKSG